MKRTLFFSFMFVLLINNKAWCQKFSDEIMAKDAKNHVGETLMVVGNNYRYEYRPNKIHPDSMTILTYLGKRTSTNEQFVIITKVKLNDNLKGKITELSKKNTKKEFSEKETGVTIGARGKIFIFEGKAAVVTDPNDVMIRSRVD